MLWGDDLCPCGGGQSQFLQEGGHIGIREEGFQEFSGLFSPLCEGGGGESGGLFPEVWGGQGSGPGLQGEEGGVHLRGREEDPPGDWAGEAGLVLEGEAHGEEPVLRGSRLGGQPFGHLLLEEDVEGFGGILRGGHPCEDDGGAGVGEVGDAAIGGALGEEGVVVGLAGVLLPQLEMGEAPPFLAQIGGQAGVELDGGDVASRLEEALGEGPQAGAHLQDGLPGLGIGLPGQGIQAIFVHQEILSQCLAGVHLEAVQDVGQFPPFHGGVVCLFSGGLEGEMGFQGGHGFPGVGAFHEDAKAACMRGVQGEEGQGAFGVGLPLCVHLCDGDLGAGVSAEIADGGGDLQMESIGIPDATLCLEGQDFWGIFVHGGVPHSVTLGAGAEWGGGRRARSFPLFPGAIPVVVSRADGFLPGGVWRPPPGGGSTG